MNRNVAKSHQLFLEKMKQNLKNRNVALKITLVDNSKKKRVLQELVICTMKFFWEPIKDELPFFSLLG